MSKIYVNQDSLIILMRTGINFGTYSATVFRMEYQDPDNNRGYWSATTTGSVTIDGTVTAIDSASGPVICRLSATSQLSVKGKWKFQPYIRFADSSHVRGATVTVYIYDRFK